LYYLAGLLLVVSIYFLGVDLGLPYWLSLISAFPDGTLNYNHRVYIDASKYYLQDALHVIRVRPALYLRAVMQSLYIFFHSSSDFELIWGIRNPIQTFDLWWNRLFYGQWLSDESPGERVFKILPLHIGWWIVVSSIIGVFGSAIYLWKNRDDFPTPNGPLVFFMLLNVLYVTVVGNAVDIGENNRFRYVIDSFILLLAIRVVYLFFISRRGKAISES